MAQPGVQAGEMDAVFGSEPADRRRLWAFRERQTEAVNAEGVPVKLDVAVPLERLAEFLRLVPGVITGACADARAIIFGHIAEGNLHVNLLGSGEREEAVTGAVLALVAQMRGSISAEHGIGVAKTAYLGLTRSVEEVAAMRAIKRALDPDGVMNPGVIFER
jgi:FAD/FMN-containing dehydrogenase